MVYGTQITIVTDESKPTYNYKTSHYTNIRIYQYYTKIQMEYTQ